MKLGYARVSSTSQSLDVQRTLLIHADCDRIFEEKRSGTSMDPGSRPELQALLRTVRPGDEVYITRLDRLARSVPDLLKISSFLEEWHVSLHVLQQNIETKTPAGRLFFTILAAIAQFETELRKERQTEGIAAAKAAGVYKIHVRKPHFDYAAMERRANLDGKTVAQIAKEFGCAEWTVRRAIKRYRREHGLVPAMAAE